MPAVVFMQTGKHVCRYTWNTFEFAYFIFKHLCMLPTRAFICDFKINQYRYLDQMYKN